MNKVSVEKLLNIGISMSKEKDGDKLLELILNEAMDMTNCDAGTLYVYKADGKLHFKIMVTRSMNIYKGMNGEEISLPPVEISMQNVCARAVVDRELKNVENVYQDGVYDFSGPKKYDSITGYHTQSMLVVPMENDYGEIIGVLQLINAMDKSGSIIPFEKEYETIVLSLASQAAIRMTGMNYSRELVDTLDSFVRVMSTAIDARTPYNANHTKNMVKYCCRFIDRLRNNSDWSFSDSERRQLLMSIWLHDVGKLVIPIEIMDKESRLGGSIKDVRSRFNEIRLVNELELAKKIIDIKQYNDTNQRITEASELVERVNTAGYLTDADISAIERLSMQEYTIYGQTRKWLDDDEKKCLMIRKGTLTDEERYIMESHVTMTDKMLDEMYFPNDCRKVPEWAAAHHEYINGTGYPGGLKGAELSKEVRLITILDIFDALTAMDRPYKSPMTIEAASGVLNSMADEGKLDKDILKMFMESRAWEDEYR